MEIEKLVIEATKGSRAALDSIVSEIQDKIYYLALRMLVNPEDAKDATQEILIKVITNLSSFKFESKFETWVYRVAVNYLISNKKVLDRTPDLTFDVYKRELESDLQEPSEFQNLPDYKILLNELRISCTMAMLLCLKPAHRMAYILGDILEMDHIEASKTLSISKDNFRKQLSRARTKVVEFTSKSCGLVSDHAKCSCEKKLTGVINRKCIDPAHMQFHESCQNSYSEIKKSLAETQITLRTLKLQNSVIPYKCPSELSDIIGLLVNEGVKTNKRMWRQAPLERD